MIFRNTFPIAVADRVFCQRDHISKNYHITVQKHINLSHGSEEESEEIPDDESNKICVVESLPTGLIEVSNVNPLITPEEVIALFEDKAGSRSGGTIHCIRDRDSFLLTFESIEGTKVLATHLGRIK